MMWLAEVFNGRYSPEEIRRFEEIERFDQRARELRSAYFRQVLSGAGRALVHLAAGLGKTTTARWASVREDIRWRRERAAAIRELSVLDDRTLRDIGLVRGEIRSVVTGLLEGDESRRTLAGAGVRKAPAGRSRDRHADEDESNWRRAA